MVDLPSYNYNVLLLVEKVTFNRIWKWQSVNFMKSIFSERLTNHTSTDVHKWQWLRCKEKKRNIYSIDETMIREDGISLFLFLKLNYKSLMVNE